MSWNELIEWVVALQGIIGAVIGCILTLYVVRALHNRDLDRMRRELWLVIVGELAGYSTFSESLLPHAPRQAGELARAIHETLHRLPPLLLNEASFASLMLEQPAICRELQIFLLRGREVASLAEILRTTLGAASGRLDAERCANLLENLMIHARHTGGLADRIIVQIDESVFKGKLGDPVAHMPLPIAPIFANSNGGTQG